MTMAAMIAIGSVQLGMQALRSFAFLPLLVSGIPVAFEIFLLILVDGLCIRKIDLRLAIQSLPF